MTDEAEWRKLDSLPSVALREAWLWSLAVDKLCASIRESTNDIQTQVDAMLLAISFRNVRRAARLAEQHVPRGAQRILRSAIDEADRLSGDALKVRNMLEHFDAYEAGVGDLQQPDVRRTERLPIEKLAREHLIYFERGDDYSLIVGGYRLSVGAVQEATARLVSGIFTAGNMGEGPAPDVP